MAVHDPVARASSARARRRLISVTVIVAGVLLLPSSASAGQSLDWGDGTDFHVFGPNEQVVIDVGQMNRVSNCAFYGHSNYTDDIFFPFTDIYVVPSGFGGGGLPGVPNTVQGDSQGTFSSEPIAATAPGGSLGTGTYAVVYDECQDGFFDSGVDFIVDPAIEVSSIPADVPPLPSIGALKADAGQQANHWFLANIAFRALFALADHWDRAPKVYSFLLERFGAGRAQEAALSAIVNSYLHYRGIEADPPDPDFQRLAPLAAREVIDPESQDPLLASAALGTEVGSEGAPAEALLASIERYQGADAASNGEWALIHARAIRDYADLLAAALTQSAAAEAAVQGALSADTRDLDSLASELEALRNQIMSFGFSPENLRDLRNLGLTDSQISQLRTDLASKSFAFSEADLDGLLASLQNTSSALRSDLEGLSTSMGSVIATLEADASVPDDAPVADAGGPYSGAEGTAISHSGAASTSPTPITTYEWDLDGDASFDDGTGATPSFTYTQAFKGFVGLRVTNSAGRSNIAYASIEVTGVNSAPSIVGFSPVSPSPEVITGTTQIFSITTSDPDGDPVSGEWFLDDTSVATGSSFSYTPGSGDVGLHLVRALATDANPLGGSVSLTWSVAVLAPDADGDGWHENVDCDDSDPTVDPGQTEVRGNGKDDDCDPATSDTNGQPIAVDDTLTTPADTAGTVEVLTNDSDPDGDALAVTSSSNGTNGAVTCTASGSCTYTPNSGFSGTDSFTYTISDGHGGSATARVNVTVTQTNQADLSITKSDSPDPITVADVLTYTLTARNAGPNAATAVTISDPLPGTVGFVSASAGCTEAAGTVTCDLGTLASGAESTVTITVRPTVANPALTNTATVSSQAADPVETNNQASTQTEIRSRAPGGVFITGHDADWHAHFGDFSGGNSLGGQHILQRSIAYVTGGKANPRLLLVTDREDPGAGYSDPAHGLTDSGFPSFDIADYGSGATGVLDLRTVDFSSYDVVVVASDFGGWLRQRELDILNARAAEIVRYVNGGGGLVAFAESGPPYGLATGGWFAFVPFVVSSVNLEQYEIGNQLTPVGEAMGLTVSDINGNVSHNTFVAPPPPGMDIVDLDATGRILSLVTRERIGHPTSTTVTCSPASVNVGQPTTCTAAVTDTALSGQLTPIGAVSFTSNATGAFSEGSCTLAESSTAVATCSVSYTPSAVGTGTHTITADYGGDGTHDTSNGSSTVAVTVDNRPPVANNDTLTTSMDTAGTVNVLANDSDPDGDALSVTSSTPTAVHGTVSCTASGSCTYTPNSGFSGTDSFTYTISDGRGAEATGTVSVNVIEPGTCPTYADFSPPTGLNLLGSAEVVGDVLRLTPNQDGRQGQAWFASRVDVGGGFETDFRFQFTDRGGIGDEDGPGADGITFAIQNASATATGTAGGSLGYAGIPNSLVVEFDTFNNGLGVGDPNGNHVAVHTRGTQPNGPGAAGDSLLGVAALTPLMQDGAVHSARIVYSPAGNLFIYVDDLQAPALTVAVNLATTLALDNGKAYVGFTSATGSGVENHDLLDWEYCQGAPAAADLSLTKADSPDPVTVGEELTYTLTVRNGGPDEATAVTVIDDLPAGVSFGSATPSQGSPCTQSGGQVTCNLGDLANAATATIEITVTPQSEGTITNTASVLASQSDPNMPDNAASEDTTVEPAEKGNTTTTYGGDSSVQYSDAASLSGTLVDTTADPDAPVPGKELGFTLGSQTASASPTDASGNASTSLVVTQKPGSVSSISTAFAGDADFTASSDEDGFTILKEHCTLAYSGDLLVAPLALTTLAADLGEPDASLGDRSGKTVKFTVVDSSANSQEFTTTTDSDGHASTTQALPSDVYAVSVSFAGDDYYNSCSTSLASVVTVQSAAAKVTGGGWSSVGTGRINFGFNAIPQAGGTYKGQFQLRTQAGKNRFHGNIVSTLTSANNTATWSGTGAWNGEPGYKYTISVVDNGSSGGKKGDTISIVISNASNSTVWSTTGPVALKGGNITVHKS